MAKSRVLQTQENKITRPFGNGHSGVDLGWQTTQTDGILAHSDGTVVFCQTGHKNNQGSSGNASYGNCVKIDHGNNYFTLYAHLSDVTVKYGQKVSKGQIIGHMGNTGNSYGTHLHFEVRHGASNCINPAPYIAADLPGLPTNDTPEKPNIDEEEDEMFTYEQFKEYMDKYEAEVAKKPVASWAKEAVDYVKKEGLMKGDTDGKFRPESNITRQEVAAVLKNMADKK